MIDRDGTVTQGAPIGKRASHAGYSNWHGTKWVNDFGIGICLNNLGYMNKHGSEFYNVNSHGRKLSPVFKATDVVYASHWNKHNGSRKKGWEKYTEQQYQSLRDVIGAILKKFPSVVDAIGHEDIAVGRKPDPGPAFDWDRIHHLFPNRHSDIGSMKRVSVGPEDNLNLRSGPSRHWGVLEKLNDGTKLQVRANTYRYKSGKAYMSNWVSVAREGGKDHIGFVSGEFLK